MDNYKVKFHFSEHLENSVQFPNLENRTFENGKPSKIRNEALNYLKSILKKMLHEKILIFKNTDEELEAAFDEDFQVVHIGVSTREGIQKLVGSKYVESKLNKKLFEEIKTFSFLLITFKTNIFLSISYKMFVLQYNFY